METLPTIADLAGNPVVFVAFVTALAELGKRTLFLDDVAASDRFGPWLAPLLGLTLGLILAALTGRSIEDGGFNGLILGFAASGLYKAAVKPAARRVTEAARSVTD